MYEMQCIEIHYRRCIKCTIYVMRKQKRSGRHKKDKKSVFLRKWKKRFSHDSRRSKNFPPCRRRERERKSPPPHPLPLHAWRRGGDGGPSRQDKSERSFAKRGVIGGEASASGGVSSGRSRWWGCREQARSGKTMTMTMTMSGPERNAIAGAMYLR